MLGLRKDDLMESVLACGVDELLDPGDPLEKDWLLDAASGLFVEVLTELWQLPMDVLVAARLAGCASRAHMMERSVDRWLDEISR